MKWKGYTFLFLLIIGLSACNEGKYYFKKRIAHPEEVPEKDKAEVDVALHQLSPTADPVLQEGVLVEEQIMPVAAAEQKTALYEHERADVLQPTMEETNGTAELPATNRGQDAGEMKTQRTDHPATVLPPASGNDKEGFILLLVLAGLLIGIGLLFYFLIPTAGLILLILFSIAAGVLLILVLLALIF